MSFEEALARLTNLTWFDATMLIIFVTGLGKSWWVMGATFKAKFEECEQWKALYLAEKGIPYEPQLPDGRPSGRPPPILRAPRPVPPRVRRGADGSDTGMGDYPDRPR